MMNLRPVGVDALCSAVLEQCFLLEGKPKIHDFDDKENDQRENKLPIAKRAIDSIRGITHRFSVTQFKIIDQIFICSAFTHSAFSLSAQPPRLSLSML